MSLLLGLILLLVAILGSGFFSGLETAVISVDRVNLLSESRAGDRRAHTLLERLRRPEWLITTLLVGTNVCVVGASTVATALLIQLLPPQWHGLVAVMTSVILTPILFFFGELLPKIIGRAYANGLSKAVIWPLRIIGWLFAPVSLIAGGLSRLLFKLLKIERGSSWRISREELRVMMRRGERQSAIEAHTARMAGAAFHFADREVREVMTPLRLIKAVPADTGIARAFAVAGNSDKPFLMVYRGRVDELVGVVPMNELVRAPLGSRLGRVMREPLYVPENKSLEGMLAEFRRSGRNLAVVVDEFGSTLGLVTLDDVLGAIIDIEPLGVGEVGPESIGDEELILPAETGLVELLERYQIELPTGDYATLGGLLNDHLERIPKTGEELEIAGWRLRVAAAGPRRVRRVGLRRVE